jgi:signal transduction histidine kinase
MNENNRILLISDQSQDHELLQACCKTNNMELILYGKQAATDQQVEWHRVDLIVIDETLLELLPKPNTIPALLITQSHDSGQMSQWLELGISDFILKPLQPAWIVNQIKQQLAHITLNKQMTRQTLKLNELGELVSLVSHEVASPLGNVNTAVSFLLESSETIKENLDNKTLGANDLERFLKQLQRALGMCVKNGSNAGGIINSFRTVATNQCTDKLGQFYLHRYLDDVVLTLKSKLKKLPHEIHIVITESLEMTSYPGAFSQVINSLINKSIIHAFDNNVAGQIIINAAEQTDDSGRQYIVIDYIDNGKGMDEQTLAALWCKKHADNTMQTTKGLSTVMLRHIVEEQLQGSIKISSTVGQGTQVTLNLPQRLEAPDYANQHSKPIIESEVSQA